MSEYRRKAVLQDQCATPLYLTEQNRLEKERVEGIGPRKREEQFQERVGKSCRGIGKERAKQREKERRRGPCLSGVLCWMYRMHYTPAIERRGRENYSWSALLQKGIVANSVSLTSVLQFWMGDTELVRPAVTLQPRGGEDTAKTFFLEKGNLGNRKSDRVGKREKGLLRTGWMKEWERHQGVIWVEGGT